MKLQNSVMLEVASGQEIAHTQARAMYFHAPKGVINRAWIRAEKGARIWIIFEFADQMVRSEFMVRASCTPPWCNYLVRMSDRGIDQQQMNHWAKSLVEPLGG